MTSFPALCDKADESVAAQRWLVGLNAENISELDKLAMEGVSDLDKAYARMWINNQEPASEEDSDDSNTSAGYRSKSVLRGRA
eukprot:5269882-Alexandrium_andersonii.AAC.1